MSWLAEKELGCPKNVLDWLITTWVVQKMCWVGGKRVRLFKKCIGLAERELGCPKSK